jgi:hypothetical protein
MKGRIYGLGACLALLYFGGSHAYPELKKSWAEHKIKVQQQAETSRLADYSKCLMDAKGNLGLTESEARLVCATIAEQHRSGANQ